MALSPHHHTGRHLNHRETSFGGLGMLVVLVGVILGAVTGVTKAETVSVSAAVVGQAPANAPVITVPASGQHFTTNPIDIRGTCNPGLLVNVYKNDVLAGAALCDANGRFSMKADLFIGRNDLIARMLNQANQQSPDSPTVSVFYDLPGLPSVTDDAQSAGSKGNVIIKAESIYKGTVPGHELSWQIIVEGGVGPYALSIDWGDGLTELLSRSGPGEFTIQHTYDKAGAYKGSYVITIKGVDSEGTNALLQIVAIVNNPAGTAAPTIPAAPTNWWGLLIAWPLWLVVVLMLVSYWLGERRQKRRDAQLPQWPVHQAPLVT